jgi:hypothetical protein
MRISTWNCAQALRNKTEGLSLINADIFVLPEAEKDLDDFRSQGEYVWKGLNKNKGLGVFSPKMQLKVSPLFDENWRFFVPIEVDEDRFRILATWAFNHRAKKFGDDAIGNPIIVLSKMTKWLSEKPAFVVGDFNNSVIWDKTNKENNFQEINDFLVKNGFRSVYHEYFQQNLGKERDPTFYHTKSIKSPYHIDYIYTNRPDLIESVEIGSHDKWMRFSDHVPIVLNINNDF